MSVHIRKGKKTKRGVSWYLDIYDKGNRTREFLGLYGTDPDVISMVRSIRKKKEMEIASGKYGVFTEVAGEENFLTYHEHYKKISDYRLFRAVCRQLEKYCGKDFLSCNEMDEQMMRDFKRHLKKELSGESPYNYFKKLKRMTKDATKKGMFFKDPCIDIVNDNPTGGEIKKDVLMIDDIERLFKAECGNNQVKLASLFAINTGLRYCDIVELKWKNINLTDKLLKFSQSKTSRQNIVPLNDNAISILDKVEKTGEYIFSLPTLSAANETIKVWKRNAKINKHVTFGVFRHTFVTLVLDMTGNLKLSGSLAGHSSIKITEKYAHVLDRQKQDAVNKIPKM